MYNNSYIPNYMNNYNQLSFNERIDNQIAQLNQMKEQMKNNTQQNNQPPAINQTFQLAPNGAGGMRYANSIDEVNKENVFIEMPFFSKDLSVLWIKKPDGNIRAFELNEIIKKDDKDIQIDLLKAQIEELRGMIKNDATNGNVTAKQVTTDTRTDDEPTRTTVESNEPTSIQKISRSKTK